MRPYTIGLVATGIVVVSGLSYIVYYDYKRRNDPHYRKQQKRERKREIKKANKNQKEEAFATIQKVLDQVAQDEFPTLAEEKEVYFMNQISLGESLAAKGEAYYHESVLPFYRALKVYPKPLDLIMIYQKTVPDAIFQIIISIMSLEQKKIQNGFYDQFPPKNTHVKLMELPSIDKMDDPKRQTLRRGLVADKNIKAGDVIYTEQPFISTLYPSLEGEYCHYCLKRMDGKDRSISCSNCTNTVFCSIECERQGLTKFHQFMCTNNKYSSSTKEAAFDDYCSKYELKYPQMITRFLSSMVAEEMEAKQPDQQRQHYSSWDHMERMRYLEAVPTENTQLEISLIKDVLTNKVPGIGQFLTDDIYLMLKGKLIYNAYPIPDPSIEVHHDDDQMALDEKYRILPSLKNQKIVGTALYKISTYIGQSATQPNVKLVFMDNSNHLTVVALQDIDKDQELTAEYILPN
ncbi:uncharacterized protein BX664DRAFT_328170 [Halteromyces radiatus]|uniref:uncharacterized protein n=1 Tax=Halteromyces radiatus TaxID=101107 RepID=UPI0022212A4A|nr:uncharacterized protein BX664DRAFT_328170 [Halteromyces radiatus]KAI8092796.1 hypothetical protein BX664DRAFT_328170 [Halteromyces radiatus]